MNVQSAQVLLREAIRDIEEAHPLKIVGLLPRGAAAHVRDSNGLDFLAEKRAGLSLLEIAQAEVDLGDRLGRPVGIVLKSELHGEDRIRVDAAVRPL